MIDIFLFLCYNLTECNDDPYIVKDVDTLKTDILGVQFDNVTMEEAVLAGAELAAKKEVFSYVVTPNPEIVNLARQDEGYRDILNQASLVLPDGIGVLYAAKILKRPLKERVPGIDFASGLIPRLAEEGRSLYLLGAKPGVAESAAKNLLERYPGLTICGTRDGYFKDSVAVLEDLRQKKADVVFVCLGAPKQERWISEFGPQSGAKLMLGLGGVLDVFSRNVKRAPKGFQKLGLEWLYRLLRQPSRLGRVAKLPLFLLSALGYRLKGKAK